MDKKAFDQFIKRHQNVNEVIEKETRKLSLKEKFRQTASLFSSFRPAVRGFDERFSSNWLLLKTSK